MSDNATTAFLATVKKARLSSAGDSNDDEIDTLWEAVGHALEALGVEEVEPTQDEIDAVVLATYGHLEDES